jgi:hypothetical protein
MSPQKPEAPSIRGASSQRDKRYIDTFYDQHKHPTKAPEGRPWHGYREFAANQGDRDGFCTELSTGRHVAEGENPAAAWATVWHAPWYPEQTPKFFEFNYLRNTLTIRYDAIQGHDRQGYDRHYEAAMKIAAENSWPEVEYGGVLRRGIEAIIGRWPRDPRIAQAAQAGDPWLLGFSSEVNTELAKLLGMSRHGISLRVEREPLVSADAVLSVPADELSRMIADAVQKAMQARDQEDAKRKEAQRQSMANARSKRGKSTTQPAA